MYKLGLLAIALGLLIGCQSDYQNQANNKGVQNWQSHLEAYLAAHQKNGRFSGNMFIAKADTILFEKSYGLANIEFKIPNSDSTRFLIGSITKPFTAYAIMLLAQEGKLSFESTLSQYFPLFPNADKITVAQLLNHTAGITDYHAFDTWQADSKLGLTPQQTLNSILSRPSIFEPGQRFSYTNSGYIFLGLIIEQVTGLSFETYIQQAILHPLSLQHTGVASNTVITPMMASGYTTTPRATLKADYIHYNQPFSSGNMYSTPKDLWRFTKAVMQSELLDAELTKQIFESDRGYGYGWGLRNYNGTEAVGHFGAMNGFVGAMTYIPDGEYFICFLTNNDNTPEYTLMEEVIKIINGEEVSLPSPQRWMPLTDKVKNQVTGNYLIKAGDTLSVFAEGDRLFLKETGQMKHELFQVDTLEFAFTLFEFNAVFSKPNNQYADTLKFVGRSKVVAHRIPYQ